MLNFLIKKPINFASHLFDLSQQFLSQRLQQLQFWLEASQQIQVKEITQDGSIYWRAYNPITGQSLCSGNELDIKAWIEQQIYR